MLLAGGLAFATWTNLVNSNRENALGVAPAAHASDERRVISRFAYVNTPAFRNSLKRRAVQRPLKTGAVSARVESDTDTQPVLSLVSFVSPENLHPAPLRAPEAQRPEVSDPPLDSGNVPSKRADVLISPPESPAPSAAPEATDRPVPHEPVTLAAIAPPSEVSAIEVPDIPIVKSRPHKRSSKPKAVRSKARGTAKSKARSGAKAKAKSKPPKVANVPRWAEKMFIPTWQDRAFGYQ